MKVNIFHCQKDHLSIKCAAIKNVLSDILSPTGDKYSCLGLTKGCILELAHPMNPTKFYYLHLSKFRLSRRVMLKLRQSLVTPDSTSLGQHILFHTVSNGDPIFWTQNQDMHLNIWNQDFSHLSSYIDIGTLRSHSQICWCAHAIWKFSFLIKIFVLSSDPPETYFLFLLSPQIS